MPEIISVQSFRGGTGKSNTTANIAALMALSGRRVGIVDTDIQSPGIHVLFGRDEDAFPHVLNDYLWGRCEIRETAYDVTAQLGPDAPGCIFLIPSSVNAGDIARIIQEGYDINLLSEGFRRLITQLHLDFLLIDTHPGLNEETLLSLAISNSLVIVMRPDYQDYQGTGITIEVARELEVPRILLLVNKVPPAQNTDELARRVEAAYGIPPAAIIPHSDEMMTLASHDLFVCRYPDHPVTHCYQHLTDQLTNP